MAQGMQETKRRITSVKVISKITKAMKLVATAKLRRAKHNFENIREYYESVNNTVAEIINNVNDLSKVFPKNDNPKTLYIVITSDLGLCGGYNSNVLKLIKSNLKSDDVLVMLGTKGYNHMMALNRKPDFVFLKTGDKPTYKIANTISLEVLSQFYSKNIGSVKLIYTKYINTLTFEPTLMTILPVKKPVDKDGKIIKLASKNYEFEPDAETVFKKMIPLYVSSLIFGSIAESKISEQSSRRTAMENATDNAEDLQVELELKYNRARQGAITQEISEIIAGSDAS